MPAILREGLTQQQVDELAEKAGAIINKALGERLWNTTDNSLVPRLQHRVTLTSCPYPTRSFLTEHAWHIAACLFVKESSCLAGKIFTYLCRPPAVACPVLHSCRRQAGVWAGREAVRHRKCSVGCPHASVTRVSLRKVHSRGPCDMRGGPMGCPRGRRFRLCVCLQLGGRCCSCLWRQFLAGGTTWLQSLL